jgi:hypothetical protein
MAKASPIKGLSPQAPLVENARVIATSRLEDMYRWSSFVDQPYAVHELHNLRIAIKRLRYTLELFSAALPAQTAIIVHELTQLQDELGELHDCDVMIALLRLCLGGQDGGAGYEYALVQARQRAKKGPFNLPPTLVATLLDAETAPGAQERYGLEQLLLGLQQRREKLYNEFRQHWYHLQARDFRREILSMLNT